MSRAIYESDVFKAINNMIAENDSVYVTSALRNLEAIVRDFPSAQPEIIPCGDCKHHHRDGQGLQYCDRIDYGYGWKDEDFCSRAERRMNFAVVRKGE